MILPNNVPRFGELHLYDNSTATVINVTEQYHFIQGLYTAGACSGWTYAAGDLGNGNITTAAAGAAINIAEVGHGLVSGDIVNVQSANHTGTEVVTRVDDDNFTVPIAYVGDEAGYWQKPDCLVAGVGSAGYYKICFSASVKSAGANKEFKIEAVQNTTHLDETATQSVLVTAAAAEQMSSQSIILVAPGDQISLQVENLTDAADITFLHSNLSLIRI